MTDKQLRSLGKTDLLRLLQAQEEEIERLTAEKQDLEKRLAERALVMEKAGSIAEASLQLSGVMRAAQESANIYLESLRVMDDEYKGRIEEKENAANRRAEEIIREAEQCAAAREALERQTVEDLWRDFRGRVDQYMKAHSELDEIIRGNPLLTQTLFAGKSGGGANRRE
ncbi:MAG: hypothetical protein LBS51_08320 [Oscillospiraceae bacterium]|jgi:hypothetical protein|nr:hypothetical protein [Oscillospiraceae bacterium]